MEPMGLVGNSPGGGVGALLDSRTTPTFAMSTARAALSASAKWSEIEVIVCDVGDVSIWVSRDRRILEWNPWA